MKAQHVKVKPVDCVPKQELANNIMANMKLIKPWLGPCRTNDKTAWIFSAGPSLEFVVNEMFTKNYFEKIDRSKHKIFCIKHALPVLKKAGIVPDFCVALDPREIKGVSTHDQVREELYAAADKQTKMLIASMTHPSVTKYLLERGYPVIGWHAASDVLIELAKAGHLPQVIQIDGGTSSAMRTLSIAHHLGIRKANLIGFDCSLAGQPEEIPLEVPDGGGPAKPKYFLAYNDDDKRDRFEFWTSGELIAQAQDLERALLNRQLNDLEIRMYGTDPENSYGGNVYEHTTNFTLFPEYEERFTL